MGGIEDWVGGIRSMNVNSLTSVGVKKVRTRDLERKGVSCLLGFSIIRGRGS